MLFFLGRHNDDGCSRWTFKCVEGGLQEIRRIYNNNQKQARRGKSASKIIYCLAYVVSRVVSQARIGLLYSIFITDDDINNRLTTTTVDQ